MQGDYGLMEKLVSSFGPRLTWGNGLVSARFRRLRLFRRLGADFLLRVPSGANHLSKALDFCARGHGDTCPTGLGGAERESKHHPLDLLQWEWDPHQRSLPTQVEATHHPGMTLWQVNFEVRNRVFV